jgi:hypothetical protein
MEVSVKLGIFSLILYTQTLIIPISDKILTQSKIACKSQFISSILKSKSGQSCIFLISCKNSFNLFLSSLILELLKITSIWLGITLLAIQELIEKISLIKLFDETNLRKISIALQ